MSTQFIPFKSTYSAEDYAKIFIDVVVCRHCIPLSTILDRGAQFTSRFLRSFQEGLDTKVKLSTVFHPQTDGQAERTIQTLEDILRACIIDFKGIWDKHLPFVEFTYNNSFNSSNSMAPYEALYGRRYRSKIGWFEVGDPSILCPDLIFKTLENVHIIRNRLQTTYNRQKSYADHRRRYLEFEKGDKVYLKISPMKGVVRFCKKVKLSPCYVGPYDIL